MKFKALFAILALIAVVAIAGCATTQPAGQQNTNTNTTVGNIEFSGSDEIRKFNNTGELRNFLEQLSAAQQGFGSIADDMIKTVAPTAGRAGGDMVQESASNGATDYSTTNTQYANVDEADFVKNDDRYIYMVTDNKLIIVDALDAGNASIISTTEFETSREGYGPYARELFISGDKLVLFVESSEQAFYIPKYTIQPMPTYKQNTIMQVYDISDRTSPELLEEYTISGGYFQSRLIGDKVYLVSREGVDYSIVEPPVIMYDSGDSKIAPEVYYFDSPQQSYQYNTVTSLSLSEDKIVDSKTFMIGYSDTIMVSEDNIYIAYQKNNYWGCFGWRCPVQENYEKERFFEVIVPLLEGDLKSDVDAIIAEDLDEDEEWMKISDVFAKFYTQAEDDEDMQEQYEDMFADIERALDEYDTKKMLENQKTVVHKINIDDGNIEYQTKAEVYGRLLNQFSLDENDGYLRLASTVDIWTNSGRKAYNNVYVLNDELEIVGTVENIAPNETIYSTRFMGDKLYMVTFRQIDPFFVVDLSNPEDPEILGQLKIPGYSSYLHPYKENYIIGVGKQTGENEWGGVSTKGVKVSLFDVSDFENPKEVDNIEIGEIGTDSPALYDHRAFTFNEDSGMLVLPISEVTSRDRIGQYGYNYNVWDGAYVLEVSEDGVEQLGKIRHSSRQSSYFDWWDRASVMRSVYMDDNLYTISNRYIKINDISGNLTELESIDLPYTQPEYMPYYRY